MTTSEEHRVEFHEGLGTYVLAGAGLSDPDYAVIFCDGCRGWNVYEFGRGVPTGDNIIDSCLVYSSCSCLD